MYNYATFYWHREYKLSYYVVCVVCTIITMCEIVNIIYCMSLIQDEGERPMDEDQDRVGVI